MTVPLPQEDAHKHRWSRPTISLGLKTSYCLDPQCQAVKEWLD